MGMNIENLYLDIGSSRINTRCLKLQKSCPGHKNWISFGLCLDLKVD